MKILDRYWTNYESPGTVDRKTRPPVLNFELVKRINGRAGEEQTPFNWRGEIIYVTNELKHPEELQCPFNPVDDEIHSSASTLSALYHKNLLGLNEETYCSKVSVFNKCMQVAHSGQKQKYRTQFVNGATEDDMESLDMSQKVGVAIDTLFTTAGEVSETTNAEVDKLAYFCIFEKELENFKLHIRKEVDIMLRLRRSYLPIELKTRTWLGMNKKSFFYQLIPTLFTRCFLMECFTVMIAVRDENKGSSITKVLFIEDIRDIVPNHYSSRRSYFRFLFKKLCRYRQEVTEIEYTKTSIKFKSNDRALTDNLDKLFMPPSPCFRLGSQKTDLVICPDPEFDEMETTLADVCAVKKWPYETSWNISQVTSTLYIVAWRFESLLDLLLKHEGRSTSSVRITVFMPNLDETPSDEEIEIACRTQLGDSVKVDVSLFEDICDLENQFEKLELYENCSHAMVLLGAGISLPIPFAVRCTDIFRISTFPRKEIMNIVTLPEKIAVFGTCKQLVMASKLLAGMKMFNGYEEETYFFAMDFEFCPNMNFKHLFFVNEHTDLTGILKSCGLPYVL